MHVQPPDNYAKFVVIDPGTTRSGALFFGVPGPENVEEAHRYRPTEIHAYNELMLYNADAYQFADEVKYREGPKRFCAFIIDKKCSDQHPPGFDISIREQYSRAFEKAGLSSQLTGHDFELGSPDVDGRELLLKKWMRDGTLKVHRHLVNLNQQMLDFFKRKEDPTKRETRKVLELVHCAEYCAAYFENGLWWKDPEPAPAYKQVDEAAEIFKDIQRSESLDTFLLRSKVRHREMRLIECHEESEDELCPGLVGETRWWPKNAEVPPGWRVLDENADSEALARQLSRRRRHSPGATFGAIGW